MGPTKDQIWGKKKISKLGEMETVAPKSSADDKTIKKKKKECSKPQ